MEFDLVIDVTNATDYIQENLIRKGIIVNSEDISMLICLFMDYLGAEKMDIAEFDEYDL